MRAAFIRPITAMRGVALAGLLGAALGFGGPGIGAARAAGPALGGLSVAAAGPSAIQPAYWIRDRYGRRIWVRPHHRPRYRRPPPPPRHYHPPPRPGWVDRYGRWHPY